LLWLSCKAFVGVVHPVG